MRLSLRFKIFALLFAVSLGVIVILTYVGVRESKTEKIGQTLESNLFAIRTLATQMKSEIDFVREKGFLYLQDSDPSSPNEFRLAKLDPNLKGLWLVTLDRTSPDPVISRSLYPASNNFEIDGQPLLNSGFLQKVMTVGQAIHFNKDVSRSWWLGFRLAQPLQGSQFLVMNLKSAKFLDLISVTDIFNIYIIDLAAREVKFSKEDRSSFRYATDASSLKKVVSDALKNAQGLSEVESGKQNLIVTYSTIGFGNHVLIGVIDKDNLFQGIYRYLKKIWLYAAIILFLVLGLSVLTSVQMTQKLEELKAATKKVSEGNFKLNLDTSAGDEFADLADGFNKMGFEVNRLLSQTKEIVRMESELQTAHAVQNSLFPAQDLLDSRCSIAGHYTPASECGGDWWYYNKLGNDVTIWIGDATGHGVSAALVTAAVRALATIVEEEDIPLSELIMKLNRVVYAASRGVVNMTFFVARLDVLSGVMQYVNASHDPPFLLRAGNVPSKKTFEPLMESISPRLGESLKSVFKVSQIDLRPGDSILFYTDGLFEVRNSEGAQWIERNLISLLKAHQSELSRPSVLRDVIVDHLNAFRTHAPLADDLTFACFYFGERS